MKVYSTLPRSPKVKPHHNVIYWPSTEPSIKRCSCVNKQKNSGSRWVLNNITRCSGRFELVDKMLNWEPTCSLRALGPQWLTVEQPSQDEKEVLLGQYSSLSLSPAYLSHIRNITLLRIKREKYIFIKKCVRLFIEVRHYCWLCFCLYFYYSYTTIRRSLVSYLGYIHWAEAKSIDPYMNYLVVFVK